MTGDGVIYVAELEGLAGRVQAQLRGWWGAQVDQWRVLRTDVIAHAQPDIEMKCAAAYWCRSARAAPSA